MKAIFGMILILLSFSLFGQQQEIIRMGNARVELFDRDWKFSRFGLQADGNQLAEPNDLYKTEFSDNTWRSLDLPHDWAIEGPFRIELASESGKLPYKGIGWYRKHFKVENLQAGERVYLDFDGAMANAKIWLNGRYVGTWPYGYSSFRMDLTPYLKKEGENVLAVRLDTENWESRWYSGAGIYRHVWMVRTSAVHVAHWGTSITTPVINDQYATVKNEVTLDNFRFFPVHAEVKATYFELDAQDKPGKQVATASGFVDLHANASGKMNLETRINQPKRWDILSPNRYVEKIEIIVDGQVSDTYYSPFGVRTIEFTAHEGFKLNGRRVDIKGVCNHHDLGSLGAAFNKSALERQLKMLKTMGMNSLRTSHNPPAPELLELADKMGILIWDEAFDAWRTGKRAKDYNKLYDEWHERDLLAMVHRDRNHPSVFIWSIGNEVLEQQDIEMTGHLADIIRHADPTRPVSNGYNDPDGGRESGAATALDIMGVNYFFSQQGRWDKDERYKNMPTLGSETSSCVSSRGEYFFGTDYDGWQVTSYDRAAPGWGCSPDTQFRILTQYPNLLGEYVWTGFDYLGEPTPYNSAETNLLNFRTDPTKRAELEAALEELKKKNPPSRSSYFGIIDLAGFPKDRFFLYQSHWRPELPIAHILPHWTWENRKGEITPVHVYTSGTEAELFVNGRSQGRKKKVAGQDFRLQWDSIRYEPGTVKVVAYKDGKEWAKSEIKTAGKAEKLQMEADRVTIDGEKSELVFVSVKVTDKKGTLVPQSDALIDFSVEGAGEIVSTDNGNAIDFTSFQSHSRKAYNGMALVIVKAKKGEKGEIRIKAKSKKLNLASVKIMVK
ncbi:beta-galactosidase GalB [Sphingobacterium detergens]|uniref:Beta-galactosidase n=1 Tax=Sphingobacterium detergens TaxID=1145106 RepID=A0A420BJR6_SPHD1|nr:beta-galactosidase GalB [Sphingobacterium detergens]RKE56963.1 beta-galactosidase [Sphingobacterium detergens]